MNMLTASPAATAPCDDLSNHCPTCDLVGLPILPLRYAVAWAGGDVPDNDLAPRLQDDFKADAYPQLPGDGPSHYTLRLLRGGYLYVFDQAADEWSAYEVDEGGYLSRFDFDSKSPPPATGGAMPCRRRAGYAMARCIQVRNASKASRVWLAFTDTAWTDTVKANHQDAGYRERHMRSIDVGDWMASQGKAAQDHTADLGRVFDMVSEYKILPPAPDYFDTDEYAAQSETIIDTDIDTLSTVTASGSWSFLSSPFPLAGRSKSDFLGLLWGKGADAPPPATCPVMVALDDPMGVASEVASLMTDRVQALISEKQRVRPLAVSAAIGQMREAVAQQAVYDSIEMMDATAERMSDYVMQRTGSPVMLNPAPELDAADLKSIRDKSWNDYLDKYNEDAQTAWQRQHEADMQALDEKVIFPLATVHAELMQSATLRDHLICNYDCASAHSGIGYRAVITRAIAGTQDKRPCAELYEQWLQGDVADRNNLILRAYGMNQDRHAEAMSKAAGEARIKPEELPLAPLFGLYASAAETVGQAGMAGTAADLITETVGPITKAIGQLVDGAVAVGWQGLVALGVGVDRPLQWVSTRATTREIVTAVMEALAESSGRQVRRRAVKLELRRLQILGVDLEQRHSIEFIGVKPDGSIVTKAGHKTDKVAYIRQRMGNWRQMMTTDTRAGLGGSLLQGLAIMLLYKKATGGMRHERSESWVRMGVASVGMFGGAMELAGKQMEGAGSANLRFARYAAVARSLVTVGRIASAAAGVLMGLVDIAHAYQERKEGNRAMSLLYLGSAGAGIGFAIAAYFTAVALSLVFFVLALAFAIAIMWLDDTPRHNWLERSLWGSIKDVGQKYRNAEIEMDEYKLAIGAA